MKGDVFILNLFHERRGLFEALSVSIGEDDLVKSNTIVRYNGTNLYGDITIECNSRNSVNYLLEKIKGIKSLNNR